jgi:hypothetical protein
MAIASTAPPRWLAAAACTAVLLSACGGHSQIVPAATANYIDGVVFRQTGFRPADTRCPSGVPAVPGGRLRCHFTGPEGPYTAYLRIVKVNGRRVIFQLDTQPSSWPAPSLGG